jgi:hypothetical protein
MFVVDINAYWQALGRFVSQFASLEKTMQVALWKFAKVPPPVAPAIFSGVRIDAATGLITRIAEAKEWSKEQKTELKKVFAQLGKINRVRNDILHYGATFTGPDELLVTNDIIAHVKSRIRETKISLAILEAMGNDIEKIQRHITALAWPERMPVRHKGYDQILKSAWRYKPR